ncbi:MAG: hypothetical protein WD403_08520 [Pirellulales bacterium]
MRARSLFSFLAGLILLGLVVFVVLLVTGVMTVEREGDVIRGEIEAGKIEQSFDRAVDKTGAALEKTGEKLQNADENTNR